MKPICPNCNSTHLEKKGVRYSVRTESKNQRYKCLTCGKAFAMSVESPNYGIPKILLFDIETALMEVYVWNLYPKFISHDNIIKDKDGEEKTSYVLSWSAKWLYDKNIQFDVLKPRESKKRKDKRILKSIWKLLDEAEIVIAHNGDKFDIKKLNTRFIINEMNPPSPFKTIDTLKIARREFGFDSNTQDYLTKKLKLPQKRKTDFKLWVDCMAGDKKRLDEMAKYNRHDVKGLEEIYLKFRPYIKNHPNLGVLMDANVCPNCGCDDLEELDTYYFTTANKFQVYRCIGCKTPYIRSKKNTNFDQTNVRSVPK